MKTNSKNRRNIYRTVLALLSVLILTSFASAEIKVSQSISDSKIAFEDSAQFQIVVEWEGSQSAYLFKKPLSPFIDRMKIGQFSSSVSSLMKNNVEFTQKKYNYTLIPTSAGLGLIDSISIGYLKRNDTLPSFVVTEPMEILIANPVAKIKNEDELNEWYLFGFALILIIGILLIVRWKKSSTQIEIKLTPKDKFLLELTTIKDNAESDLTIFQTELSMILTNYIVTEYKLDDSLVKTDSLTDELSKAGMSIVNAEQITAWMEQAEIDKFAPLSQAPGAVVRLESEIRTFFEKI